MVTTQASVSQLSCSGPVDHIFGTHTPAQRLNLVLAHPDALNELLIEFLAG
jgi:hypothetical protein